MIQRATGAWLRRVGSEQLRMEGQRTESAVGYELVHKQKVAFVECDGERRRGVESVKGGGCVTRGCVFQWGCETELRSKSSDKEKTYGRVDATCCGHERTEEGVMDEGQGFWSWNERWTVGSNGEVWWCTGCCSELDIFVPN